jgi:hypothetical protein
LRCWACLPVPCRCVTIMASTSSGLQVTGEIPKELHPDFEGRCLCGKKFFVDTRNYAVIHELPMCQKFESLDIVEYLRYIRQATTTVTDN